MGNNRIEVRTTAIDQSAAITSLLVLAVRGGHIGWSKLFSGTAMIQHRHRTTRAARPA